MMPVQSTRVQDVSPGLYSGQSGNNPPLYFGFEEVDKENFPFWNGYKAKATYVAGYCGSFCRSATADSYPEFPNKYSTTFNYNEQQYHDVMKFIQKKGYFKRTSEECLFTSIRGGTTGMGTGLSRFDQGNKVSMVYASNVPVKRRHTMDITEKDTSTASGYNALFGDILMSVVFITDEDAPTVTFFGVFRNPLNFLDTQESHKGIVLKLFGFASKIALTRFRGKKYMVNEPLPSITKIFIHNLSRDSIHLGTNDDLRSLETKTEEEKELLKNYPPIFHRDLKTSINKIAKEGVDLSEHLDSLPDEKAEFISKPGQYFDFGGWTMGSLKTVINLEKLAEFYV